MSYKQPQYLQTLQTIAGKAVESESEKLLSMHKYAEDASSKLDMLIQYRDDYRQRMSRDLNAGLSAKAFLNYQGFLGKLDEAIVGQEQVLAGIIIELKAQRRALQESQRRKLSYEVLAEQGEKKALHQEAKQEQKNMDEIAMRGLRLQR